MQGIEKEKNIWLYRFLEGEKKGRKGVGARIALTKYPPKGKRSAEHDTKSACNDNDDESLTDGSVEGGQGRT